MAIKTGIHDESSSSINKNLNLNAYAGSLTDWFPFFEVTHEKIFYKFILHDLSKYKF